METKPKTKMQMVREYLAEHPNAKTKEVTEAVGCCTNSVVLTMNADRYERQKQRQKVYDHQKYLRNREKIIEQKRQYRAAHREEIKAYKRRYYAEKHPKTQNNYKRHGQTWSTAYTKAEAIRQYAAEHPEATIKEVCSALQTHSNCIAKAAPLFYKEKVRKPAPHPVPNTIAAMQREQDRLLELMADAPTTAMYQELARQYSVLQMKIDYATAMANDANRELVRSRAAMEKRPLCQIVANGNGFAHH
jgi:hypothetical protein